MLLNNLLTGYPYLSLTAQSNIVTVLIITVSFFLILLIAGIRKSYKLKSENERLSRKTTLNSEEDNKIYKDFTEGHLYDNK
ncbi:hypothetical protein D7030_01880 [Flavobacteriaceae bacterium AU392]|nr:hypothetical protein D1817_08355 [Flavobacteriaceae bacterium]RKM85445.1 hypothetical protein D7030_01880 [Flavobacteriaceae bacterium AU392]